MVSFNKTLSIPIAGLITGIGLLIFGLLNMKYEIDLGPIELFVFIFPIIFLPALFLSFPPFLLLGWLLMAIVILSGNFPGLIIISLITYSSYMLGKACLFKLKLQAIDPCISFLIGIGLFGTAIGLGAHRAIAYPGIYGVLILLPLLLFPWNTHALNFKKLLGFYKEYKDSENEKLILIINSLSAAIGVIYFLYCLLPELGYDALVYHLFIPAQMAHKHFWGFDVEKYIWAVFPLLGDWIYSLSFVLSGESATRIFNYFFMLIGARIVFLISKELGLSSTGKFLNVLIYFSCPLTFAVTSTLYVETIWGAYFMAACYLIIKLTKPSEVNPKIILSVSMLLALSAATKMSTILLLPTVFMALLIFTSIFYKSNSRVVLYSVFIFLPIGLVPNITAFIKTGNPFFPILNNIFKSPFFFPENFTPPHNQGIGFDTLYKITFNTGLYLESYVGGIGFHLILLTPLLIVCIVFGILKNRKLQSLLFICIVGIISIFITTSYVRYAYPLFTMLGICCVAAIELLDCRPVIRTPMRILVVCIGLMNVIFLTNSSAGYRIFNLPAIISNTKKHSYLMRMNSLRVAIDIVNGLNEKNMPVACFSQPLVAGLKADALHPNWYNAKFQNKAIEANTAEKMKALLKEYRVNYVIVQEGAPILMQYPKIKKILEDATKLTIEIDPYLQIRSVN